MFRVELSEDTAGLRADLATATGEQIEKARTSALRKMRKRVETRVKSLASKRLKLPQKAIADRFFSNKVEDGADEMTVWIGTWAVSPFSIGSPRQTARGVRVGRRSYRGAFLGEIYSGTTQVWMRLHSKHYSPNLYPTNKRPGDRGWTEHRGRFPVVRAAVPIDNVMQEVIDTHGDEIAQEFEKIYLQELNYFVNVKGNA